MIAPQVTTESVEMVTITMTAREAFSLETFLHGATFYEGEPPSGFLVDAHEGLFQALKAAREAGWPSV